MKIDENPDKLQSLDTVGVGGAMEPTPEMINAIGGPAAGTLPVPTQADLDRQASTEAVTEGVSLSPVQASLRRLGRDRRAMFFLAITLMIIVIAYVGPLIYTRVGPNIIGGVTGTDTLTPLQYHNYVQVDINRTDADPSFSIIHPLGTDQLGRDILARLMAGVNISIEVALLVEILDIGLGVTIGTLAGYYGGWLATFLDRFTDIMFAFPGLLFAILAAATLGPAFQNRFGLPGRLILVSYGARYRDLAVYGAPGARADAATARAAVHRGGADGGQLEFQHYHAAYRAEPVQYRGRGGGARYGGYDCQ